MTDRKLLACNAERICEEAEVAILLLHLRCAVELCFVVER
jgi:hypothetical protein